MQLRVLVRLHGIGTDADVADGGAAQIQHFERAGQELGVGAARLADCLHLVDAGARNEERDRVGVGGGERERRCVGRGGLHIVAGVVGVAAVFQLIEVICHTGLSAVGGDVRMVVAGAAAHAVGRDVHGAVRSFGNGHRAVHFIFGAGAALGFHGVEAGIVYGDGLRRPVAGDGFGGLHAVFINGIGHAGLGRRELQRIAGRCRHVDHGRRCAHGVDARHRHVADVCARSLYGVGACLRTVDRKGQRAAVARLSRAHGRGVAVKLICDSGLRAGQRHGDVVAGAARSFQHFIFCRDGHLAGHLHSGVADVALGHHLVDAGIAYAEKVELRARAHSGVDGRGRAFFIEVIVHVLLAAAQADAVRCAVADAADRVGRCGHGVDGVDQREVLRASAGLGPEGVGAGLVGRPCERRRGAGHRAVGAHRHAVAQHLVGHAHLEVVEINLVAAGGALGLSVLVERLLAVGDGHRYGAHHAAVGVADGVGSRRRGLIHYLGRRRRHLRGRARRDAVADAGRRVQQPELAALAGHRLHRLGARHRVVPRFADRAVRRVERDGVDAFGRHHGLKVCRVLGQSHARAFHFEAGAFGKSQRAVGRKGDFLARQAPRCGGQVGYVRCDESTAAHGGSARRVRRLHGVDAGRRYAEDNGLTLSGCQLLVGGGRAILIQGVGHSDLAAVQCDVLSTPIPQTHCRAGQIVDDWRIDRADCAECVCHRGCLRYSAVERYGKVKFGSAVAAVV